MSAVARPIAAVEGPAKRNAELGLAIAVVFVLALMIVPLPAVILDLLLATSIGLSLVVLLTTMQTTEPLEFSSFPSLLLLLTLFRLGLNFASTRLILSEGHAGEVIQAFGSFVIGFWHRSIVSADGKSDIAHQLAHHSQCCGSEKIGS